jgi:hypothetical protein
MNCLLTGFKLIIKKAPPERKRRGLVCALLSPPAAPLSFIVSGSVALRPTLTGRLPFSDHTKMDYCPLFLSFTTKFIGSANKFFIFLF